MENPLEYIRQHPQLAKQLIGLNLPELESLIKSSAGFHSLTFYCEPIFISNSIEAVNII